ncbi:unnamed protein product [Brassicogethes aeneus]|uniref:Uncharacterized protein n=1 Tax=Brassicogethes aeneus TaxID=1431903 RepID=A0A9P0AR66_BRAAE|nr:unnamed protein product [Brassicogethes aeneus]
MFRYYEQIVIFLMTIYLCIFIVFCRGHVKLITCDLSCSRPLPKVVNTSDWLNIGNEFLVTPKQMVIYRCGVDTGCCEKDMFCQTKAEKKVNATIFVEKILPSGENQGECKSVSYTSATACHCLKFKNPY